MTRRSDHRAKIRIGDVLLRKGLISQEALDHALLTQRTSNLKLGEVLVRNGLVTRRQLRAALSKQRWHNWTATLLLATGSLATALPKVVSNVPNVAATRSVQSPDASPQTGEAAHGGGGMNDSPGAHWFNVPLTANRFPSVDSPLQGFCHPLNGAGYLSQGIRGTTHRGRMEYAYDLAVGIGMPVYAMRSGQVLSLQDRFPDTGGGREKISKFNYILVQHEGGYRSAYLHLQQGFRSKVSIKAGDRVQAGQLIGYSGNSGWSTGPHLHIELQKSAGARSFGKTVPFTIAGRCEPDKVALK